MRQPTGPCTGRTMCRVQGSGWQPFRWAHLVRCTTRPAPGAHRAPPCSRTCSMEALSSRYREHHTDSYPVRIEPEAARDVIAGGFFHGHQRTAGPPAGGRTPPADGQPRPVRIPIMHSRKGYCCRSNSLFHVANQHIEQVSCPAIGCVASAAPGLERGPGLASGWQSGSSPTDGTDGVPSLYLARHCAAPSAIHPGIVGLDAGSSRRVPGGCLRRPGIEGSNPFGCTTSYAAVAERKTHWAVHPAPDVAWKATNKMYRPEETGTTAFRPSDHARRARAWRRRRAPPR